MSAANINIDLAVNTAKLESGFKRGQQQANSFLSRIKDGFGIGLGIKLFNKAESMVQGIIDKIPGELKEVSSMGRVAERLGMSVRAFSSLQYAAQRTGVDVEHLQKGMLHFSNTVTKASEGNKEATELLARFGLTAQDFANLPLEEKLAKLADAFKNLTPDQRLLAATELFGARGVAMASMLSGGSAAIEKLTAQARQLGIAVNDDDVRKAREYTRAVADTDAAFAGMTRRIALESAPAFATMAQAIATLTPQLNVAFTKVFEFIGATATLISALSTSKKVWESFWEWFGHSFRVVMLKLARVGSLGINSFFDDLDESEKDMAKAAERFIRVLTEKLVADRIALPKIETPEIVKPEIPEVEIAKPKEAERQFAPALIRGSVEAYSEAIKLGSEGTGNRINEQQLKELQDIHKALTDQDKIPLYEARL